MERKKRKLRAATSLLLALLLCACFGTAAFAAEAEPVPMDKAQVGDTVVFGSYEQNDRLSDGQEPLEWIVLDEQDGQLLLLSKYCIDSRAYSHAPGYSLIWENSEYRAWLNGEFYDTAFTRAQQALIVESYLENPKNSKYGTKDGHATWDKVFALSIDEAIGYLGTSGAAAPTAYAKAQGIQVHESRDLSWWWLRSLGKNHDYAATVWTSGSVGKDGKNASNDIGGVRPCVWVTKEDAGADGPSEAGIVIWENVSAIVAGDSFLAGLRADGTLQLARIASPYQTSEDAKAWGRFSSEVSAWKSIQSIACGGGCLLGLKADGSVVSATLDVGGIHRGTADVTAWRDIVSVAVNGLYAVGLQRDGRVVVATMQSGPYDEVDEDMIAEVCALQKVKKVIVPFLSYYDRSMITAMTEDGSVYVSGALYKGPYVDYACSGWLTAALRDDGTVELLTGTEDMDYDVLGPTVDSWRDLQQILCGDNIVFGLKKDGGVVYESGYSLERQTLTVLDDWEGIAALYAGPGGDLLGVSADGHVRSSVFEIASTFENSDYSYEYVSWLSALYDWTDVCTLAKTDGCVAALRSDGRVLVACEPEEHQLVLLPG